MNGKRKRMRRIWRRALLIVLLIAPVWLAGCVTVPQRIVGRVVYSDEFLKKLADEIEQGQCGPRCVAALADWEAVMVE